VKGYVVRKGSRFYAVIYEGVDPLTGRERRRWHPAGESRCEAELLAAQLAASASAVPRQSGPTLATYLLRQWLPAKEINLLSTFALSRSPTFKLSTTGPLGFVSTPSHLLPPGGSG
jgi:hypothetical protein